MRTLSTILLLPSFLSLIQHSKSLTHWFDIKHPGKEVYSGTIAGESSEWVVQGKWRTFIIFTLDWSTGAATFAKELNIPEGTAITAWIGQGRMQLASALGSKYVSLASRSGYRFNADPSSNEAPTRLFMQPGSNYYSYPQTALNTNFVFFGGQEWSHEVFLQDLDSFEPECEAV